MNPRPQILGLALLLTGCTTQPKPTEKPKPSPEKPIHFTDVFPKPLHEVRLQISEYVPAVIEDRKGNLWFGTNGDGAARYNGKTLQYYTPQHGFPSTVVRAIAEDHAGNIWFATDDGVCRLDGNSKHPCFKGTCNCDFQNLQELEGHLYLHSMLFKTYTIPNGLHSNHIFSILADRKGTIWVATLEGPAYFDAKQGKFQHFELPAAKQRDPLGMPAKNLIWSLFEDKAGNIWFATNGAGAFRYDGKTLTQFTKEDGLVDNFIQAIAQDKEGNIWLSTRHDTIDRFDGKTFTHFTKSEGFPSVMTWTMQQDKAGNIWLGTAGNGAIRYDGKTFTAFTDNTGISRNQVQAILEDRHGRMWFGLSGGLFRLAGDSLLNVTKQGPWD